MSANKSRKQLIKAIVLTVGVADCVGIYLANNHLGNSVPDDVRYDQSVYALPTGADTFRTQPAMFANAAPAATRPAAALPAAQPVLALGAPAKAAPDAPAAVVPAAPRLAAASAAQTLTAPSLAAHIAAPKPEGPRSASITKTLAALQPAPRAASAAPAPALAHAAILTPHLAKVERPEAGFRTTTTAKIADPARSASLALAHAAPAKASLHRAPAKSASSLAGLVPKARASSEFASAFAGFDAPLAANVPIENAATPADSPAQGAFDFAHNQSAAPVLENVLPELAPAPEPLNASADSAEAAL